MNTCTLEKIKLAYLLQNCFWSISERNQNANKTQPKRKTKLASYPDCRVTVSCFNISLDDCVWAMNPERNTKTQPKCETVCRFAPKRNSKRKSKTQSKTHETNVCERVAKLEQEIDFRARLSHKQMSDFGRMTLNDYKTQFQNAQFGKGSPSVAPERNPKRGTKRNSKTQTLNVVLKRKTQTRKTQNTKTQFWKH